MCIFNHITQNPAIMGGRPCISGNSVTVSKILGQMASGRTTRDILDDYPYPEKEDITQALRYAAWLAGGCKVVR